MEIIKTVMNINYYLLKHNFILNFEIMFYIFNDLLKLINFEQTYYKNKIYVKNSFLLINKYGNVSLRPIKKRIVKIN